MTIQLVECVPNFSEGKDPAKIKQITDAIVSVSGIELLDVEMGADTHRTVVTFVGSPEAIGEAAFRGIQKASEVIDMTTHKGEHPRMGATDVCPFVPVEGVTMEECAAIARKVGERVGKELKIPVYLYEGAAARPDRANLADIRRGEYEGFFKKIKEPQWKPDYGPGEFNARSGATVIGAREFLIAYNITLNSTDKQLATEIAFDLREKGRVARAASSSPYYFKGKKLAYAEGQFPCGNCDFVGKTYEQVRSHCESSHSYDLDRLLKDNDLDPSEGGKKLMGKNVYRPGKFKSCKAIGWYVDEYKRAQISINLTNYKVTPPHVVLEEARRLATERGLVVTGSEIVGLIPYQALLEAGKFYLRKQGKTAGVPVTDVLRAAVFSMGLSDITDFDIQKKVLGLPKQAAKALVQMKVSDFADEVSRDTPAPGGGSIAALAGALGASLASMVAGLTHGKEGTEAKDPELSTIAEAAQRVKDRLMALVDEDTNAFNAYMQARRLPQNTPEEKAARQQKMQEGLKIAIDVPWTTAQLSFEAMRLARQVAQLGNPNSITDGAVGVQMGFAGVRGGIWNVLINLKTITDSVYVQEMRSKTSSLLIQAQNLADEAGRFVDSRLSPS